jgi:hypothetical protein
VSLVVPDAAEALLLNAVTGKTPATVWTLRAYTALSPSLSKATVVADVTEAVGGGYAAIPLTAASWVTTPGTPTSSTYPKQTWALTALTGNPAILGYYVTNAAGALVYLEPLAASFTPGAVGYSLEVTPTLTLGSLVMD